jgi:hypothetical protein
LASGFGIRDGKKPDRDPRIGENILEHEAYEQFLGKKYLIYVADPVSGAFFDPYL